MSKNPAQRLHDIGQSVWYDNISREIIENGELQRLVNEWGVRGLTSNPSIFDVALKEGNFYDAQVAALKKQNLSVSQVFEELALQDIAAAADMLKPVYHSSNGDDGYCSIEVSPTLAHDTEGTIEEARRLFARLERPNIMVKIPGTPAGLPAIKQCLIEGININITLLFSVENYRQVALTYCEALRERLAKGEPVAGIRSVASFFVSRVDTIIDKKLDEQIAARSGDSKQLESLKGQFGIANCKVAYQSFLEIFGGEAFAELKRAGAVAQRPLWASTSVKDPSYRDVRYIEELAAAQTVNTMPHSTLAAFVDHGEVREDAILSDLQAALALEATLEAAGVNVAACLAQLQVEGVDKFSASFDALHETLKKQLS